MSRAPPPITDGTVSAWFGAWNGGLVTSGSSRESRPASEWMRVTSTAWSTSRSGRSGDTAPPASSCRRRADRRRRRGAGRSGDLEAPTGEVLATHVGEIGRRGCGVDRVGVVARSTRSSSALMRSTNESDSPRRSAMHWARELAPCTSIPGTIVASAAFAAGTTTRSAPGRAPRPPPPARRAPHAADRPARARRTRACCAASRPGPGPARPGGRARSAGRSASRPWQGAARCRV